jgi:plastocyanin
MKRLLAAGSLVLMVAAGQASAAVVNGQISFVTKRGQRPVVNETVIWLEPLSGRTSAPAPATVEMATRNKSLLPHVMTVPAGSTVQFPNEDPISHNLFSLSPGNSFDLGLYRKGAGKAQKFDTPGVVNVYCNVHPNMSAVIHVMPTPHYGFADASGRFSFEVPAGRYRVVAWNEQGGMSETMVEVRDNAVSGSVALTIDSRNFRAVQHKNKQGRPYQAPSSREY